MGKRNETNVDIAINVASGFIYMFVGLALGFGSVGLFAYGIYRLITG